MHRLNKKGEGDLEKISLSNESDLSEAEPTLKNAELIQPASRNAEIIHCTC